MSRRVVDQHADWLGLLEPDGAFLTAPVLAEAFPTGLERAPASIREEVKERFAVAPRDAPEARRRVEWLVREALGYKARFAVDAAVPDGLVATGQRGAEIRADGALVEPREGQAPAVRLLLTEVPAGVGLDTPSDDPRWSASPVERLARLLRAANVPLGLVTNGRHLALVWAPREGASGHGIWDTELFAEERVLLDALISILHARRFFPADQPRAPHALFRDSTSRQAEVTKELGRQVRQAVELLVGTLARADHHQGGDLLPGDGRRVYDAAVTVMMRLVFCLYAEERRLLPAGLPSYEQAYAVGPLLEVLNEEARLYGPELLEHRTTGWHRLLATFRAIHGGIAHEDLSIPAYGGGLFDPDRYPFLEGRAEGTAWHETPARPLPVDDRTVLEVLRALQELRIGGESRRLSFRTLDVEQIGHVYEGLLDHSATRTNDVYLGFAGKNEPEIALGELESLHTSDQTIATALKERTGLTANKVEKGLKMEVETNDERMLVLACGDDVTLADRVKPYVGLLRRDLRGLPVVIPQGSMMVTQTSARRDSGTQYTARELADEIAVNALEPLVFNGPSEGLPDEEWRLRTAGELLELRVCDPAVGSGAIIVAALRYLSERLLEAWEADGTYSELAPDDRLAVARREVAEHCLYGVDRDPLALEMAKLSLWLSTMAKDRPFTFLDHSFKCGDSLLGITSLAQVRHLHLDPGRGREVMGLRTWSRAAPEIVDPKIEAALGLIGRLVNIQTVDVRTADEKRRLERAAQRELEALSVLADMVVAAAMVASYRRRNEYETALLDVTHSVTHSAPGSETAAIAAARSSTTRRLQAGLPDEIWDRVALHWPLAFPEVFLGDTHSGFDAFVGNPPFRGGQYLTEAFGTTYREYLVAEVAAGRAGSADYVSYFFLRATRLLRGGGHLGFIATNSIAQGKTRRVGLDSLLESGWTIRRAVRERPWPGGAGVHVAQVWMTSATWNGESNLDGTRVLSITAGLTDGGRPSSLASPPLTQNKKLMFMGATPGSEVFFGFSDEDADRLRTSAPHMVRRFLTGGDICDTPEGAARRWCLDTFGLSEDDLSRYPAIREWLVARIDTPTPNWWLWERPRPALRKALDGLPRYIAAVATGKRLTTSWQATAVLASNLTIVLASDDDYVMGVVTSRIHEVWARSRPSSLEDRLRYTPSEMFETFPFPPAPSTSERALVAEASRRLHTRRRELCLEGGIGLTELYNRMDRGEVDELRELHEALDRAVATVYRWDPTVLTNDDDDDVLANLVALSEAITAGRQRYTPGIRPEKRSDNADVGENLRISL